MNPKHWKGEEIGLLVEADRVACSQLMHSG